MQAIVAVVVSCMKLGWPVVEPLLIPVASQVAQKIGAELLANLKAGILTAKYPFLAGTEKQIEAIVTPYLSPEAIAAEVAKLATHI